jgi:hypothetical protein
MPPSVRSKPWKQREEWLAQWAKTPEARAEQLRCRSIDVPVAPNGTFRVDDVPPGSYVLTLRAFLKAAGGCSDPFDPDPVGCLRHEFVVPKPTAKDADKPLDLGELTLEAIRRPQPGQAVPPLEFETLEGKRRRLADFRGKLVLLHLWRRGSGRSMRVLPKALRAFPNVRQLVIVEVGICDSLATASLMDKVLPIGWPRGFLDEEAGRKVANDFGLPPETRTNTTLLIAPDRKVIAANLSEDEIIPAIAKALDNPAN